MIHTGGLWRLASPFVDNFLYFSGWFCVCIQVMAGLAIISTCQHSCPPLLDESPSFSLWKLPHIHYAYQSLGLTLPTPLNIVIGCMIQNEPMKVPLRGWHECWRGKGSPLKFMNPQSHWKSTLPPSEEKLAEAVINPMESAEETRREGEMEKEREGRRKIKSDALQEKGKKGK